MTVTPLADPTLLEPEMLDPRVRPDVPSERDKFKAVAPDDNGRLAAPRGIVIAVLLSVPFWIVAGLVVYFTL